MVWLRILAIDAIILLIVLLCFQFWRSLFAALRRGVTAKTLFISHSYKDADIMRRVKAALPKGFSGYAFPAQDVQPNNMVSAALMRAIRHCAGVVYIDSPNSISSPWVTFERAFGAHLGISIYRFDPTEGKCHEEAPLPVSVHLAIIHPFDEDEKALVALAPMFWRRYKVSISSIAYQRGREGSLLFAAGVNQARFYKSLILGHEHEPANILQPHIISRQDVDRACSAASAVVIFYHRSIQEEPVYVQQVDQLMLSLGSMYKSKLLFCPIASTDVSALPSLELPEFQRLAPIGRLAPLQERAFDWRTADDIVVRAYWLAQKYELPKVAQPAPYQEDIGLFSIIMDVIRYDILWPKEKRRHLRDLMGRPPQATYEEDWVGSYSWESKRERIIGSE